MCASSLHEHLSHPEHIPSAARALSNSPWVSPTAGFGLGMLPGKAGARGTQGRAAQPTPEGWKIPFCPFSELARSRGLQGIQEVLLAQRGLTLPLCFSCRNKVIWVGIFSQIGIALILTYGLGHVTALNFTPLR